jgi:hypothetical protein
MPVGCRPGRPPTVRRLSAIAAIAATSAAIAIASAIAVLS